VARIFRHVWPDRGNGIFSSLHAGPLPDEAYARTLPADITRAATGIPAIDSAVRELYATGTLHNHARLWRASYVVPWRKVHWRKPAQCMAETTRTRWMLWQPGVLRRRDLYSIRRGGFAARFRNSGRASAKA
jgi:hypothetical protein